MSASGYANTKSSSLLPICVPGMVIFIFVCRKRQKNMYITSKYLCWQLIWLFLKVIFKIIRLNMNNYMLGSTFYYIFMALLWDKKLFREYTCEILSKYVVFTTPWVFFQLQSHIYVPSTYIRYKVALLQGLWNCLSLQREVLIGVDIYIIGIEPLLNTWKENNASMCPWPWPSRSSFGNTFTNRL